MTAAAAPMPPAGSGTIDRQSARQMFLATLWMSALLGVLAQVLIIIGFLVFDEPLPRGKDLLRDTAKSIVWPVLICTAIAFAKAAALLRDEGLQPKYMAVAGFIAAPLGLTAARLLHRALGEALSLGPRELAIALFGALVAMKMFQYGFIGAALGRVQRNPNSHWFASLSVGLVADAVFGVAALVALAIGKEMQTVDWINNGIGELVVPVGCAMIVFFADRIGRSPG